MIPLQVPPPFSALWLLIDFLRELLSALGWCTASPKDPASVIDGRNAANALHRVAAARPILGQRTQGPVSKKYVQQFLKADTDGGNTQAGMLRKVEGLIAAMDERVVQNLERLDTQLGGRGGVPQSDEELRVTLARVAALMERTTNELGVGGPRAAGQV